MAVLGLSATISSVFCFFGEWGLDTLACRATEFMRIEYVQRLTVYSLFGFSIRKTATVSTMTLVASSFGFRAWNPKP